MTRKTHYRRGLTSISLLFLLLLVSPPFINASSILRRTHAPSSTAPASSPSPKPSDKNVFEKLIEGAEKIRKGGDSMLTLFATVPGKVPRAEQAVRLLQQAAIDAKTALLALSYVCRDLEQCEDIDGAEVSEDMRKAHHTLSEAAAKLVGVEDVGAVVFTPAFVAALHSSFKLLQDVSIRVMAHPAFSTTSPTYSASASTPAAPLMKRIVQNVEGLSVRVDEADKNMKTALIQMVDSSAMFLLARNYLLRYSQNSHSYSVKLRKHLTQLITSISTDPAQVSNLHQEFESISGLFLRLAHAQKDLVPETSTLPRQLEAIQNSPLLATPLDSTSSVAGPPRDFVDESVPFDERVVPINAPAYSVSFLPMSLYWPEFRKFLHAKCSGLADKPQYEDTYNHCNQCERTLQELSPVKVLDALNSVYRSGNEFHERAVVEGGRYPVELELLGLLRGMYQACSVHKCQDYLNEFPQTPLAFPSLCSEVDFSQVQEGSDEELLKAADLWGQQRMLWGSDLTAYRTAMYKRLETQILYHSASVLHQAREGVQQALLAFKHLNKAIEHWNASKSAARTL